MVKIGFSIFGCLTRLPCYERLEVFWPEGIACVIDPTTHFKSETHTETWGNPDFGLSFGYTIIVIAEKLVGSCWFNALPSLAKSRQPRCKPKC